MTARIVLPLALLLLAGCGQRTALLPPPGEPLPIAPATLAEPPSSEELLALPVTARPVRVDELVTRSEAREDDRFDIPPQ